jgi:hypothetical protein
VSQVLHCNNPARRADVRSHELNGLDFVEVSDDQRTLTVYFLGKAPASLTRENIRIDGGQQVRDLRVVALHIDRSGDQELDDRAEITLDRPGDCSRYTLRLVERDVRGRPGDEPLKGIDPRYATLPIDFKLGCAQDTDCAPVAVCPPLELVEPALDYLAKDYESFRGLILDRLAQTAPGWTERHVPDLGIALVELLAYVGDQLSYAQDAVGTEAYLETARRRISVQRHCRLVDYRLHEGCDARAWLTLTTDVEEVELDPAELIFAPTDASLTAGAKLSQRDVAGAKFSTAQWYEPLSWKPGGITLRAKHGQIQLYTWGDRDCCLPMGATSATLADQWLGSTDDGDDGSSGDHPSDPHEPAGGKRALDLHVGDVLIFEEVLGPRTGVPEDADRSHRHPVMLTTVTATVDPLYELPVVEIAWSAADALPFALCISCIGDDCGEIDGVSVARANVILVDHGRSTDEQLGPVPTTEAPAPCDCASGLGEPVLSAGQFTPALSNNPLTFAEPVAPSPSAAALTTQDPRAALPAISTLQSTSDDPAQPAASWTAVLDLLLADPGQRVVAVEIDDDGAAHLRFARPGGNARTPGPGDTFECTYRVGNGTVGNVAAEAITRIGRRTGTLEGAVSSVRNPLPASGGTDPESLDDARLLAPSNFRLEQERAVTADDYAAVARRDPRLQGAAAQLEWTGSWYEATVSLDPLGSETATAQLLDDVDDRLHDVRRLGHDLRVTGARYVPIDLALCVCVLAHYQRGHVERALHDALGARRLPDGTLGLFHPDRDVFAGAVAVSPLIAAACAVEGVESAWVTRLRRLGEADDSALRTGALILGAEEIAQLDDDPAHPDRGQITLRLEGGR